MNGLQDAQADQLCRARRYQRSAYRVDKRSGQYERKLETKACEVTLRVPVQVAHITEALRGIRTSSGAVSRLNQKIYRQIEARHNRDNEGELPYAYLDGVIPKPRLAEAGAGSVAKHWNGSAASSSTCTATRSVSRRTARWPRWRTCSRSFKERTAAHAKANELVAQNADLLRLSSQVPA